jgi:hypothetical protein
MRIVLIQLKWYTRSVDYTGSQRHSLSWWYLTQKSCSLSRRLRALTLSTLPLGSVFPFLVLSILIAYLGHY